MKTLLTSAALFALVGSAHAGVVDVTPTGAAGFLSGSFGNSGGGSSEIVASTLFDADGALAINGDRTRFGISNAAGNLGLLSDLVAFNFDWAVEQEGATVLTGQAPALRLNLTDPASGRSHELIWEDGEQSSRQFVAGNGSLNTVYSGDFFGADPASSRVYAITSPFGSFGRGLFDGGGTLLPGSNSAQAFDNFLNDYNLSGDTFVSAVTVGVGSSVGDFRGFVDNVTIGFAGQEATTFNFVVPAPGAAALLALGGLASTRRRR